MSRRNNMIQVLIVDINSILSSKWIIFGTSTRYDLSNFYTQLFIIEYGSN